MAYAVYEAAPSSKPPEFAFDQFEPSVLYCKEFSCVVPTPPATHSCKVDVIISPNTEKPVAVDANPPEIIFDQLEPSPLYKRLFVDTDPFPAATHVV